MSNREDDFLAKTVKTLAERVAFRCSKPDCPIVTIGPHSNPYKSSNVGVAAHITAASEGGARYDATFTSEQRRDISNGIWLCEIHAKEIDNDEVNYPVELLNKWKREAELKSQITTTTGFVEEKSHEIYQTQISQLTATVARLSLSIIVPEESNNLIGSKYQSDISRALKWSESGEISKVQAAQQIILEIRGDAEFSQSSNSLQSRLATAAAVSAVSTGDNATADKEAQAAFRLDPDNIKYLSNMAGVAIMRNEFERAATLAEQVRIKEPQNENAALVLMQAWHHTDKAELVEQFLRENPWFLDLPNGCAVVAQIRSNEGRFIEAIDFAKQALKKDKNHIQSLEVLYDAIFVPLRDRVLGSEEWDFSLQTRRKLQRAEATINRAISFLEKAPDKSRLHRALSNRAAVRSAQEKTQDAFADVDRILQDNPTDENRDAANLNKAMILIHVGKAEEALPYVQELKTDRWKAEGMFALAYSYHISGQSEKAIKIWESLWKPEICDAQQLMTASLLLWAYRRTKNSEAAESVLSRAHEAFPGHPDVQYLKAQDKYDCGDVDGAIAVLKSVADACRTTGNNASLVRGLMSLGDICYRTDRVKEAIEAWKEIGWVKLLPLYRDTFVNLLYRSGELVEALKVAQSIRQQIGFQPRAAEVEARIYSYSGDYKSACEIWKELAQHEPENHLHKINRAHVALMSEDKEETRKALDSIPYGSIKNDAQSLRRVSSLQNSIGHKEAIRFAFRARQIDFGNPESHNNYVTIFLESTNHHSRDESGNEDNSRAADVIGLNGPRWGEVPCTIRLLPVGETDERNYRAFTILNDPPFDLPRGIYPPNHDLAKELLAIRSSDEKITFQDSPVEERKEFQISEVLSPYVHAFQESMLHAQEWFKSEARVWSIDVRDGFDEFWKFMDAIGNGFQELVNHYKEWKFPLHTIAANRGRSMFDLWFFMSSQKHLGIHAERGNLEFFEQSVKSLKQGDETPTLVLDSTSLLAIVYFDLNIVQNEFRLIVSQSLYRSVQSLLTDFIPAEVPADLPDRILKFVENNTEVLPAKAVIQFAPEDILLWQRVLGEPDLDAALLAFEHNALLFSDDTVMREAVRVHPGVDCTSTQVILEYLYRREKLSRDGYFAFLEKLSLANYRHLLLNADFFIWLLEKHDLSVNKSVRHALFFLEGPMCSPESAIRISAFVVATFWTKYPLHKRRFEVLEEFLSALSTGHPALPTIHNFCLLLAHPQFELRKENRLQRIFWYVASWQAIMFPP